MKSRKILLTFLSVLLAFGVTSGQSKDEYWKRYRLEASFGIGPSMFLGELGGGATSGSQNLKDLNFLSTRYAISGAFRYKFTRFLALKTSLIYGRLYGADRFSADFYRNNRNLDFRSGIFEASTTIELGLGNEGLGHRYRLKGVFGRNAFQVYTYLFAGVGMFHFNPQGSYQGKWYDLPPLSTEGEGVLVTRDPYHLWQMCIPLGIGFKYTLDQRWGFGLEIGYRTTFTDYIDDVSQTYPDMAQLREVKSDLAFQLSDKSVQRYPAITAGGQQRGNPVNTDSYIFAFINLNYRINTGKIYRFKSDYYKDISPLF